MAIRKADSSTAITATTAIYHSIFSGEHLLVARLRRSNIDGAAGAVEELTRIVSQIRQAWPVVKIIIRADSGFCRDDLMTWCEKNGINYVLGLAKNERLKK